jgi:hypothetical protein
MDIMNFTYKAMKTKLLLLAMLFLFVAAIGYAQDGIPLYLLEKAPGENYIPVSDGKRLLGFVHKDSLGIAGGGSGWMKDSLVNGNVLIDADGNSLNFIDLSTFSVRDQDGIGVDYNITAPTAEGLALVVERIDDVDTAGIQMQYGRMLFYDSSGVYTLAELAEKNLEILNQTDNVVPIKSGDSYIDSKLSHPTTTRTILSHNSTYQNYWDIVGNTAVNYIRHTNLGNLYTSFTTGSGGGVGEIMGNSSSAGGYLNTASSTRVTFTNNPFETVAAFKIRVRAPGAGANDFVDAMNVSTNGRIGIGNGSVNPRASLHVFGTDGIIIPGGTTAERGTILSSQIRLNTTKGLFEAAITDASPIDFVHIPEMTYNESDIIKRIAGNWMATGDKGFRVDSIQQIQNGTFQKGDVLFYAGGRYVVEDTTYLLLTPGSNRNYGNVDDASRVQTANGKIAHLQADGGRIPLSPFVASYSILGNRSPNPDTLEIRSYDDTEAWQRAIDYTSRLGHCNLLNNDMIWTRTTDTVIIEQGCLLEGHHTGIQNFNQTPLKGRVFVDVNDPTKNGFVSTTESSGGYLGNVGMRYMILHAFSPIDALVVMYENSNTIFERNTLRGTTAFQVSNDVRNAKCGVRVFGSSNQKMVNNNIFNIDGPAFHYSNDWSYKNTTQTLIGNTVALTKMGVLAEYCDVKSKYEIYQTIDSSAFIIQNGRLTAEDLYFEEVPTSNIGAPVIDMFSDEDFASAYIHKITTSSKIDVSDPINDVDFIRTSGISEVQIDKGVFAGYRKLIETDARTLKLEKVRYIGNMLSPISGDYTGIDTLVTDVQLNQCIDAKGNVINKKTKQYTVGSDHKNLYSFENTWIADTLSIENVVLQSKHQNLVGHSDEIDSSNSTWRYNPSRVTVVQNDTLFEGNSQTEKITVIGTTPILVLDLQDTLEVGGYYILSFYYANSSVDEIGVKFNTDPLAVSFDTTIIQNSPNYTRYSTLLRVDSAYTDEVFIYLENSIGDSIHLTNVMFEQTGSKFDTRPGEYISTTGTAITNTPKLTGNLEIEGNLKVTGDLIPTPDEASGAPASTPRFKGQIYINDATGDIYMASGISSSSDWQQINN